MPATTERFIRGVVATWDMSRNRGVVRSDDGALELPVDGDSFDGFSTTVFPGLRCEFRGGQLSPADEQVMFDQRQSARLSHPNRSCSRPAQGADQRGECLGRRARRVSISFTGASVRFFAVAITRAPRSLTFSVGLWGSLTTE